jgi:D-aspartate ligase
MRIDKDTPVVVLRLDHWGALGVMRSLGRLGVPVYGVDRRRWAPALVSRWARGGFVWDLDAEPPQRSVARLLQIAAAIGGRPLLVPSNDETALFVAANADALRPAFRFQDNPHALVEGLYNKRSMYEHARALDIPTAETRFPRCREDVVAFAAEARFPVMLKGSDGIALARRSGEKMVIVHDAEELLAEYDRLEDASAPDLMLQEYIPGGEDAQWMFNGYFDGDSRCLFGLTGRKLRQTPPYTGMTCLGVCTRNDEVAALTLRLAEGVGYRGCLDIGFRFDARDGRYKVLDVNPRLGSTFRLFVDGDGMDVMRAQYLDVTGQPVPPAKPVEGRRWFVEDFDLLSSARYFRDRSLTPLDWARSFAGVEEAAWFAADDPAPFVQMCGRFVGNAARKVGRKLGVVPAPAPVAAPPVPDEAHDREHQAQVLQLFAGNATSWQRVYDDDRLQSLIYRHRHELTLRWADDVGLPPGARVLDLGCGAGHTSVALAARGYHVNAVDLAPEMVALVDASARSAGLSALSAAVGDAHALDFDSGSFDLVVALGLLPWLHGEVHALAEMARVLRRGGWLILTADAAAPLHRLIDPRTTPLLAPVRRAIKRALGGGGVDDGLPPSRRHDARSLGELLRTAGLEPMRAASVGFGQFTMLGRPVLSARRDAAVQRRLQRLADEGWPILRDRGSNHVFMARKAA